MYELPKGESGYFSAPDHGLDPHLFDAEHLKPDVRAWVEGTIFSFLSRDMHLLNPPAWLHIWIAGSGVTYQWNAGRGNGDLDVLVGISMPAFFKANSQYKGIPDADLASWMNQQMRDDLWPKTAHQDINGHTYEVTFYWNPGVGADLTIIHPYAAYDVLADKWKVRPPKLPADPTTLYDPSWVTAADDDLKRATDIYQGYYQNGNSPRYAALAKDLLESIHGGRKAAFAEGGKGYGDWANYRWQSGKQHGIVAGLSEVVKASEQGGQTVDPASIVLTRAMMRYNSPRYDS